jgi:hypothetical protein
MRTGMAKGLDSREFERSIREEETLEMLGRKLLLTAGAMLRIRLWNICIG